MKMQALVFLRGAVLVRKAIFQTLRRDRSLGLTLTYNRRSLLRLFKIAWRYQLVKPNCLPTSLALQSFLANYGYPSRLQIGVQKNGDALKAHAWLEDLMANNTSHSSPDLSLDYNNLENL